MREDFKISSYQLLVILSRGILFRISCRVIKKEGFGWIGGWTSNWDFERLK